MTTEDLMKKISILAAVAACAAARFAIATPVPAEQLDARSNERPVLLAEAGRSERGGAVDAAIVRDTAHGPAERRAREAAARGPAELRRLIERTQGIYALRYEDYLKP
jgi:hypothetical protein